MVELETLLTSIASSVQASQAAIQQNAYTNFERYFIEEKSNDAMPAANGIDEEVLSEEEADDEVYTPVMQRFKVSDSPESADIAVPAVALVNHNSLVLENVKIVLNVSGVPNGNSFMVNTEPMNTEQGSEHHQITLEFKQEEPTEGMSRILTAYNQFL